MLAPPPNFVTIISFSYLKFLSLHLPQRANTWLSSPADTCRRELSWLPLITQDDVPSAFPCRATEVTEPSNDLARSTANFSTPRSYVKNTTRLLSSQERFNKMNTVSCYCVRQWVLAFDLAISPLDNISESPGFESCLIERKNSLQTVGIVWRHKIQIVYYQCISINRD